MILLISVKIFIYIIKTDYNKLREEYEKIMTKYCDGLKWKD
jgi:hypothetical protein